MTAQTPELPAQVLFSDFSVEKANTRIDYMYRDASNYKEHLSFVLDGAMSLQEATRLCRFLGGDGDDFLPLMVGLEAADWSSDGGGGRYKDDHPWHELTRIEPTDAEGEGVTVQQFLAAMEAAHAQGWEPGHATKWKLRRDGERDRLFKTYQAAFNKANGGDAIPYKIIPPLSEMYAD